MPESFNIARSRPLLQNAEFSKLFIEELGWEPNRQKLTLSIGPGDFELKAIAGKRGFTAWACECPDGKMPDHATRLKLDRKLAETSFEHLIVFITADRACHSWMWMRREKGQPIVARTHEYQRSQPGDSLLQKLETLYVSLEEEESGDISTVAMAGRARAAFDVERVTKAFYRDFDTHRKSFLGFIKGIGEVADREWYASVMLNRLMFVYFIQRKGFLDGDHDYLRKRLELCKKEKGKDQFYSFYRYFLLRLFHEGFGKRRKDRAKALEKLLGNIPYLNGGLFDVHELEKPERYGTEIQIPDKAFEAIFDFFEKWDWQLDPARTVKKPGDKEQINPDVLGYIFEKYINQKQMGAYYTKEDITEYIGKNTVIPFLFNAARAKCKVAFENTDGPTVWDLLCENPDRYIYPAVRHGTNLKLPKEIAAGLDTKKPDLIQRRKPWNKAAPPEFALPTEIWREVVARRQRYEEVRDKLAAGEVREINDFITLNLDLRQFAQDVITRCEGPDLLRAIWSALTNISVLDPTCGSGAFLFAALNILELLYEACLDRMAAFLEDEAVGHDRARLKTTKHGVPLLPNKKFEDFSLLLEQVDEHPNRRYFIFKRIILKNLFGVDLMKEAVEICKLRLFLKLASQIEPDSAKDNLGIEPLPDIDFNIRPGNTLVGYATADEVRHGMRYESSTGGDQMRLGVFGEKDAFASFEEKLLILDAVERSFREQQTTLGGSVTKVDKDELIRRKNELSDELNEYMAGECGENVKNEFAYSNWLESHQPFHWFIEFHEIVNNGGFDVIIGNPPYVAAAKVRRIYKVKNLVTDDCSDIYAWVLERSQNLLRTNGRTGMIVPLSLGFSSDFDSCRRMLFSGYSHNWFSSYGRIPAALFNADVRVRNTIHIALKSGQISQFFTTRLHRWFEVARATLLEKLEYAPFQPALWKNRIPKLNTPALAEAFEKALAPSMHTLDYATSQRATKHVLHFKKSAYNWLNFCRSMPPCYEGNKRVDHTKFGKICFSDKSACELALLISNGKLMMIYWFAIGDDFDVTRWNFADFPADLSAFTEKQRKALLSLVAELEKAMEKAVQFKLNAGRRVGNYNLAKCRHVTDRSDLILAEALGFADVWEDIELYYAQTMKTDFSSEEHE